MPASIEDKLEMVASLLRPLADALADKNGGELTADDLVDVFACGIAAVISNDDEIVTPDQRRLALQKVVGQVGERLKPVDLYLGAYGQSFLSAALDGVRPAGSSQ